MTQHQRLQGYSPSRKSMFNPTSETHTRTNSGPSSSLYNQQTLPRPSAYNSDYFSVARPAIPPQPTPYSNQAQPPTQVKAPPQQQPQSSLKKRYSFSSDTTDEQSDASISIKGLRTVHLPRDCLNKFISIASYNTARNVETCGLLLGKPKGDVYIVTVLLIPKQTGTKDTCNMEEEELVSQFTDERNLITLGWVQFSY